MGSLAETPQHDTPLTFSLTLDLHHAVLLQRASFYVRRVYEFITAVLPLILKPITAVLPLCSLDMSPFPRLLPRHYRACSYRVIH